MNNTNKQSSKKNCNNKMTKSFKNIKKIVLEKQRTIFASSNNTIKYELQEKLFYSKELDLVAIKTITGINKGKKTPGIDNKTYRSKKQINSLLKTIQKIKHDKWNPKPVKRIFIARKNSNTPRALGIPIIIDRILQYKVKACIEPEWESIFSNDSYGFRPKRNINDVMTRIKQWAEQKDNIYVMKTDIQKCFDKIDHTELLKHFDNSPFKIIIKKWLTAGIIENNKELKIKTYHKTIMGTPQGGVISPLLCNIALNQIDIDLNAHKTLNNLDNKILYIRYADDIIVFAKSKQDLEPTKNTLIQSLQNINLQLSTEKTEIKNLSQGIDVLGFNIICKKHNKTSNSKCPIKSTIKIRPDFEGIQKTINKIKDIWLNKSYRNKILKTNEILLGYGVSKMFWNSKHSFKTMDHIVQDIIIRNICSNTIKINKHPKYKSNTLLVNNKIYLLKLNWLSAFNNKYQNPVIEYNLYNPTNSHIYEKQYKTIIRPQLIKSKT